MKGGLTVPHGAGIVKQMKQNAQAAFRIESDLIARVDAWRATIEIPPSRSAAIRRLIERGLADAERETTRGNMTC